MNGGFLGVPDRAEAVPGLALHTASFLLYHASMPGTVCHRHATLRRTLPGWLSEATCCHPHDRGRVRRCARPPSGPGPTPVGPGRGLVQVPRAATRPPTPGTTDLRTTRWPDRWRGGAKHPPPLRSDRPLSVPVVASSRFPARPPALRHQEQPTFGPPGGPIVGEAAPSTPRHSDLTAPCRSRSWPRPGSPRGHPPSDTRNNRPSDHQVARSLARRREAPPAIPAPSKPATHPGPDPSD